MSLNIVAAWPIAIVAVSDRRVSDFGSKKALTNRSTKMTIFGCADAHGLIVYNGIGWDDESRDHERADLARWWIGNGEVERHERTDHRHAPRRRVERQYRRTYAERPDVAAHPVELPVRRGSRVGWTRTGQLPRRSVPAGETELER